MEYQLLEPIYKLEDRELTTIERIFSIKGISPEDINHYLNVDKNDVINPLELNNIHQGVIMLIKHIKNNDPIFIVVDSDADGFTSAACLINYLNYIFPAYAQSKIIYKTHPEKAHGVEIETIPAGTKLVIIPDAGSNQYEEHKILKEQDIDVLVIDHHLAPEVSEYACVINNQLCDYPNKSLSGVGVVYKFCSYIDQLLGYNYSDNLLDLVAVGMIGDVMDLRNYETKYLISKGLSNIRNPFLKSLIEKQSFVISKHGGLDPFTVGFYIAPMVNAVIRVGSFKDKMTLFESMLDFKGNNLVPSTKRGCAGQTEILSEQACRICTNVKKAQTDIRDTNVQIVTNIIESKKLLENKILLILLDSKYQVNKNLTGLIANQLMSTYQRPVLLLNESEINGEKAWEGSGRGPGNFKSFLNACPYVAYGEGHEGAMGVGILDKNVQSFIKYSNEALKDYDFSPSYKVDCIFQANNFKAKDILDIAELKNIWGKGIDEPLICIENLNITKQRLDLMSRDKNPTLKIIMPNGVEAIKFKSSEDEFISLYSDKGAISINLVGKCSANTFGSTTTPQILIEDYEITAHNNYYF